MARDNIIDIIAPDENQRAFEVTRRDLWMVLRDTKGKMRRRMIRELLERRHV